MATFLGIPKVLNRLTGGEEHLGTARSIPENPLQWGDTFREGSAITLKNPQMRKNLRHATTTIRNKRNMRVEEMPDWEDLRVAASAVKHQTMSNLPELLEQFEANVTARGGIVHWARDAAEANAIVLEILKEKAVSEVIKVKSMATQEINLNEELAKHGIHAHETDLAEMIVQLAEDMPSHIVVPAIHRNRAEIKALFEEKMNRELSVEPRVLAMAARERLRQLFLTTKVAISGANMGIAETGTLAVFESEGNGRMCLTLPETLITVMGIEKLVPTYKDVEIFSQLLPRSATGERMNPYTSFWTGVTPGDGPQEFHLILMDNGRTRVLADEVGRQALHCIRCGACMNACPVYERVGGWAYNSVYPGPIGAILTPQLIGAFDHHDPASQLPFASSLCGACFEACPVRIDIPSALVSLRHRYQVANAGGIPDIWDVAMGAASQVMRSGERMDKAGRAATKARKLAGKKKTFGFIPAPLIKEWTRTRDIPAPPEKTFRQWWEENKDVPPAGGCGGGTCGCRHGDDASEPTKEN